jgi:hypothetical protein
MVVAWLVLAHIEKKYEETSWMKFSKSDLARKCWVFKT